jgi:hypothetical protein
VTSAWRAVMAPLLEPERRDFWEIHEDGYQVRSSFTSRRG